MIIIKDMDFEMEQVKTTPFFDLKMPVIINAGKDNERTEMKLIGYGMPFHACLQHIIPYKLGQLDKTFTIAEYIQAYANIVLQFKEFVTYIKKEPKKKLSPEEEDREDELEDEGIIDESEDL